jgi:hypothetical protein
LHVLGAFRLQEIRALLVGREAQQYREEQLSLKNFFRPAGPDRRRNNAVIVCIGRVRKPVRNPQKAYQLLQAFD